MMSFIKKVALLATTAAMTMSISHAAVAAPSQMAGDLTDDWILLSATGIPTQELREYTVSLADTQTTAEFEALSDGGPAYFVMLPDRSAVGAPFPEGTSQPELVEAGLLDADGRPTSALIERFAQDSEVAQMLAVIVAETSVSLPPMMGPMAVTPGGCFGTDARTHRYALGGKLLCEGWKGLGTATINRNNVKIYHSGDAYGKVRYRYITESLYHHIWVNPYVTWDFEAVAEPIYINTLARCASRCV